MSTYGLPWERGPCQCRTTLNWKEAVVLVVWSFTFATCMVRVLLFSKQIIVAVAREGVHSVDPFP